eukprot:TRINITY_DN141620_c0_g1_i3.p1 TRINITY_DN141620_c0_g1~~TRINITY_DN141620_c0_g1_i3.p1  ORF type:complete len:103 (+),score=15.00 TRINITY_DN141620_c0_g1_i3:61-369(+)
MDHGDTGCGVRLYVKLCMLLSDIWTMETQAVVSACMLNCACCCQTYGDRGCGVCLYVKLCMLLSDIWTMETQAVLSACMLNFACCCQTYGPWRHRLWCPPVC